MAVAHEAHTSFTVFTDGSEAVNHPGVASRGALVFVWQGGSDDNASLAVTYGGVPMLQVVSAADTATETFRVYAFFLGAGIPEGTQSVAITGATLVSHQASVMTVTADTDTEIADSGVVEEDAADPQVALDTGLIVAQRYVALYSGHGTPLGLTDLAVQTSLRSDDLGNQSLKLSRETTPASGAVTVGYTGSIEDTALVGVAIAELAAAGGAPSQLLYYI